MGENRDADAPIRVLLADDHTLFRQGLAGLLASHGTMEVVAEVPNDEDALHLARELRPDAVVMQVQMPFVAACCVLGGVSSGVKRRHQRSAFAHDLQASQEEVAG